MSRFITFKNSFHRSHSDSEIKSFPRLLALCSALNPLEMWQAGLILTLLSAEMAGQALGSASPCLSVSASWVFTVGVWLHVDPPNLPSFRNKFLRFCTLTLCQHLPCWFPSSWCWPWASCRWHCVSFPDQLPSHSVVQVHPPLSVRLDAGLPLALSVSFLSINFFFFTTKP